MNKKPNSHVHVITIGDFMLTVTLVVVHITFLHLQAIY